MHISYMRATEALASLSISAFSLEPSVLAGVISTKILCKDLYQNDWRKHLQSFKMVGKNLRSCIAHCP